MKKALFAGIAFLFAFVATGSLAAASQSELKATYDAAVKKASTSPNDYAANWQAAKAAREYGDHLVGNEVSGWKETAKAVAKDGMKYGEVAFKLNASGIEGWYWYGVCVGTYSDCVSIVTALTEGLKGKTQKGFENAYKFDKNYENGGPILALGRFWQSIPAIAGQDRKKAEQLYTEYINLFGKSADPNSDAWAYRGELYKDMGGTAEARADLQKAASMGDKNAAKMLSELK